jgi:aryl-alcohol dehydrogenase-like predicted oxidoreductase
MQPVRLGQSGLNVSTLCLGTMNFGADTEPETAAAIADMALEHGLFFWDTADMYSKGRSEEIVGELLRGRREQVVLATKAFAQMGPGPNDGGLSARHILSACEGSLRRLNTDWIDLYYLHLPDRSVPLDETLRAMEDLVRSGKVRYIACSNYRAWEVMELLEVAKANHWQAMTAIQPLYNIVNRDIEVELLPMARAKGLGVVTYSPLARGVLTGKYRWNQAPPSDSRLERSNPRFLKAEWREASVAVAAELDKIAQARGHTTAQLAVAWAAANQLVDSVIIGPRTLEQMADYIAAMQVSVDSDFEAQIDALVPPGCHSGHGFPDWDYYPVNGRVPTLS